MCVYFFFLSRAVTVVRPLLRHYRALGKGVKLQKKIKFVQEVRGYTYYVSKQWLARRESLVQQLSIYICTLYISLIFSGTMSISFCYLYSLWVIFLSHLAVGFQCQRIFRLYHITPLRIGMVSATPKTQPHSYPYTLISSTYKYIYILFFCVYMRYFCLFFFFISSFLCFFLKYCPKFMLSCIACLYTAVRNPWYMCLVNNVNVNTRAHSPGWGGEVCSNGGSSALPYRQRTYKFRCFI